jgi:hypothetical protein
MHHFFFIIVAVGRAICYAWRFPPAVQAPAATVPAVQAAAVATPPAVQAVPAALPTVQ